MAVRKSLEDRVVMQGERAQLLARCHQALTDGGFKKVTINETLFQLSGIYRQFTASGRLDVTLTPTSGGTEVVMRATGNVDNIFALFSSPNQKILQAFKGNL